MGAMGDLKAYAGFPAYAYIHSFKNESKHFFESYLLDMNMI